MDYSNKIGKTVTLRDGTSAKIIAFCADAPRDEQLVILRNDPAGVRTLGSDGRHDPMRVTQMDIVAHTRKIRMRVGEYRLGEMRLRGIPEDEWERAECVAGFSWVSEPFEAEVEA